MNPWLYLLSMVCAHSCNFSTPQVMQMMMIGMRTIDMSIRFEVNQSTFVPVWNFHRESYCIRLRDLLSFRYVINTTMVYLRFVYLCVQLFLGHIWVFYASYFVFQIWVWHVLIVLWFKSLLYSLRVGNIVIIHSVSVVLGLGILVDTPYLARFMVALVGEVTILSGLYNPCPVRS